MGPYPGAVVVHLFPFPVVWSVYSGRCFFLVIMKLKWFSLFSYFLASSCVESRSVCSCWDANQTVLCACVSLFTSFCVLNFELQQNLLIGTRHEEWMSELRGGREGERQRETKQMIVMSCGCSSVLSVSWGYHLHTGQVSSTHGMVTGAIPITWGDVCGQLLSFPQFSTVGTFVQMH